MFASRGILCGYLVCKLQNSFKQNHKISAYIGNIYREQELDANSTRKDFFLVQIESKSEELDESATCAKIAQVRFEGNRRIERTINTYNLDMIISVGYRVNSKYATRFRMWANRILKEYLTRGYAINHNAKAEQLEELKQTIAIRMAHAY